jgi:2-hydroxychromene-2-carboxylate isomerase
MSTTVEIYYSFQSPYAYLALDSLYEIIRSFDAEFIWQPFSAKAAGQQIPVTPVIPEKLSYLFEDTKRYADEQNLPLVYPDDWPQNEFDPGRITRGAVVALDLDVLMEYNYKVFHKCWGLGENPNSDEFMSELCEDLDIDLGEFLSKVSSSDTRERVKGIYKRGKKFGVFDTPTIVIGNDRFVGLDKLATVRRRLEQLVGARKVA